MISVIQRVLSGRVVVDGTVVGEAQGDESALNKFVQHLNMGPRHADVKKVDQKDIATKDGENGFK